MKWYNRHWDTQEYAGTVDAADETTSGSLHGSSQRSLSRPAERTDAQAPEPTGIRGCSTSASSQPGFGRSWPAWPRASKRERARADKDHVARQVRELWLAAQSSTDDGWRKMAGTVTSIMNSTNQWILPQGALKVMSTDFDSFDILNGAFVCTGSFSGWRASMPSGCYYRWRIVDQIRSLIFRFAFSLSRHSR